jgi:hypothetical protein
MPYAVAPSTSSNVTRQREVCVSSHDPVRETGEEIFAGTGSIGLATDCWDA